MKRYLTIALAIMLSVFMLVTLVACQDPAVEDETTAPETTTEAPETTTKAPETTTTPPETTTPAAKYKVTFVAGDETVAEVEFSAGDDSVEEPAVPAKTGYTGAWKDYVLGEEDITVEAVYTAIKYKATFKADGTVVEEVEFTVEDDSIEEPAVPAKAGFTGKWADYELGAENITINAVYTELPATLTVTFVANEVTVKVVEYTEGDTELSEIPEVPAVPGYEGAWEEFELDGTSFTVNAVYTRKNSTPLDPFDPEEGETKIHKITFVVDLGEGAYEFATLEFEEGARLEELDIPTPPAKEGYRITWESFVLGTTDIVVNAIVEEDTTTPWI